MCWTSLGWKRWVIASSVVMCRGCFLGVGVLAMTDSVNLCTLIEQFGSEDRCRAYLEALRWPDEIACPRCKSDKISQIVKRNQFDCDACRYQFSVTAGTIFNDSHLPLWKWFLCVYLLCESKKGMSANQISRTLGISYKTAWYLCHRIRAAMHEVNPASLGGTVEIDETYIGGRYHGPHGMSNRLTNKEIVIGIRQRGGALRFFHAEDIKTGTLAKFIKENVRADVDVVMTDELGGYPKAMIEAEIHGTKRKTIKHKDGYVDGDITTNGIESAFSLLKRGIIGSWHKVSAKHLSAYLDEMTFRFNNRDNPFLFRDTLLKLIDAPVLEYKKLTAA
jgi:transposase-like protein